MIILPHFLDEGSLFAYSKCICHSFFFFNGFLCSYPWFITYFDRTEKSPSLVKHKQVLSILVSFGAVCPRTLQTAAPRYTSSWGLLYSCHVGSFHCLCLTSKFLFPRSYVFISLFIPSFYWSTISSRFLRTGSGETFLLPSLSGKCLNFTLMVNWKIEYRILGWKSFSLRIWKALCCFFLASSINIEKANTIIILTLCMESIFSPWKITSKNNIKLQEHLKIIHA